MGFSVIYALNVYDTKSYHGASLNYGKDAAEDPRTDEQLPLLAQMQVDMVQNHWQ